MINLWQIPKMTVDKKLLIGGKKFSTKFDDLGVIIMRKQCATQQGEKNNCSPEQSPKKLTVPFFFRPPTNETSMANPENDSP